MTKISKEKTYTIGEIFRLGLLKNHKGEAYKDKGTVSRVVNSLNFEIVDTAWGRGKRVSESEISKYNKSRLIS